MREQDDHLNEDISEDPIITGTISDLEDEPVELPENAVDEDDELQELILGER